MSEPRTKEIPRGSRRGLQAAGSQARDNAGRLPPRLHAGRQWSGAAGDRDLLQARPASAACCWGKADFVKFVKTNIAQTASERRKEVALGGTFPVGKRPSPRVLQSTPPLRRPILALEPLQDPPSRALVAARGGAICSGSSAAAERGRFALKTLSRYPLW